MLQCGLRSYVERKVPFPANNLSDTSKIPICSILTTYFTAINGHQQVTNSIWQGCERCSKNVRVWLKL